MVAAAVVEVIMTMMMISTQTKPETNITTFCNCFSEELGIVTLVAFCFEAYTSHRDDSFEDQRAMMLITKCDVSVGCKARGLGLQIQRGLALQVDKWMGADLAGVSQSRLWAATRNMEEDIWRRR